jgi:sec-independent protein translocase protein TatA
MFGPLGSTELIVIVLVLLLLFGGKKIPEMMRGLGTGVKEFKKATNIHEDPEQQQVTSSPELSGEEQRWLDEKRRQEARQREERRQLEEGRS